MQAYGICSVGVAPIRKEAKDASEMVSQLVFGEKVTATKQTKNWSHIKCEYDGYEGWVDTKQILWLQEKEFQNLNLTTYSAHLFNMATDNSIPFTVPIAAPLFNLDNGQLVIPNGNLNYLGETISPNLNREQMVEFAQLFLNIPYLWGGRSSYGIDCSGFVQQVFKLANIQLPRDAYQQAEHGNVLSFVNEAQPGDLAFFDNDEGRIIHVGLVLEGNKIIHAHGKVRIDILDTNGIFNLDRKEYSHKLRFIKRLFAE